MPHLNRIGFTHFRVFEQRTELALAPITILTGTNSSGKSSVLKAFQLLQENIKDLGYLNFAEGEHKLGNFELSLNRNAKDKTITFMLPIEHDSGSEEDKMYADLVYELDETNELKYGKLVRLSVCSEKNKKEVIGVSPWYNIDIDFEYFHHKRILKYNLDLLEFFKYSSKDFYNEEGKQNVKVLRNQSLDFLTYTKNAREIIKQLYQTDNEAQQKKLLKIFKTELPIDFELYLECENYLDSIETCPPNHSIGYFLIDLPEKVLKKQIQMLWHLDMPDDEWLTGWNNYNPTKNLINKKILTKEEFVEYATSTLSSVREELRQKYKFENQRELSQLLFESILKIEHNEFIVSQKNNQVRESQDYEKSTIHTFLYNINRKKNFNVFLNFGRLMIEKYEGIINHFYAILKEEDDYGILVEKIFQKELDTSTTNDIWIYPKVEEILKNTFGPLCTGIFNEENFYYLEAVRANTQRLYTFQSQGTSFNRLLIDFIKKKDEKQMNLVNKWLNELGVAKEFKIEVEKNGIGSTISLDGKALADLGYGVTQLLPILMSLATIKDSHLDEDPYDYTYSECYNKKILYIEEPETNLHPKLQSKLADIFVEACQVMKIQLIIETHSEYLIRKLQYLTAKKTITPDMTVIHYFYDPKEERPAGEPQVKQINIQPDGRLTAHFGTGFYDESARLMMAILTGDSLN